MMQLLISINNRELAGYYIQKASNLLLQKFFQNKIIFIDIIGNPWVCIKKSCCLIQATVLCAKPAYTDDIYYCCITSQRWEMVTWLTPGGDESHLLKPPVLFLVLKSATPICKIPTCIIPYLHECVGFCSTRCSQEDFTEEMENAACWTHGEWIFQLAPFLRVLKISIRFRTTNPSLSNRDHISIESRTKSILNLTLWRDLWEGIGTSWQGSINPEGGVKLFPLITMIRIPELIVGVSPPLGCPETY